MLMHSVGIVGSHGIHGKPENPWDVARWDVARWVRCGPEVGCGALWAQM